MAGNGGTFRKGHTHSKGVDHSTRRSLTICLVSKLNELVKLDKVDRKKMDVIVDNLIFQAMYGGPGATYNEDGSIKTRGHGDLEAIKEVWNRLEGKPQQKIVGADDGPLQVEYHSYDELKIMLIERKGIDISRLPPVLPKLPIVEND